MNKWSRIRLTSYACLNYQEIHGGYAIQIISEVANNYWLQAKMDQNIRLIDQSGNSPYFEIL